MNSLLQKRNAEAAQLLSDRYSLKISRIPLPPIVIQQPLPAGSEYGSFSPNHANGHSILPRSSRSWEIEQHYTAEDVAHDLEMDLLGSSEPLPHRQKSKIKDKRTVSGATSDADSEVDTLVGPAVKRRKLEKTLAVAEDEDIASIAHVSMARNKSKVKHPVREQSPDSISTTPRAFRKKLGPKKKLENDNENPSHPPSIAGDVTPAVSRPTSPAPTASSLFYELDDAIPPLKKAKKVDDHAMLKRIKTLEDAQRKVWTNIAKKDVAKVCILFI